MQPVWETSGSSSEGKAELPHDPEIPKWKHLSAQSLNTNIHSSIMYNSQKVETTHMSISYWVDKENSYNGILFSNIKELSIDIWQHKWTLKTLHWVKEVGHKWPHISWFHLNETSRIGTSIGTESRLVLPGVDDGKCVRGQCDSELVQNFFSG